MDDHPKEPSNFHPADPDSALPFRESTPASLVLSLKVRTAVSPDGAALAVLMTEEQLEPFGEIGERYSTDPSKTPCAHVFSIDGAIQLSEEILEAVEKVREAAREGVQTRPVVPGCP